MAYHDNETLKKEYGKLVKQKSPKVTLLKNCLWAFFVGGGICTIGQLLNNGYKALDFSKQEATTLTSVTLIFLGALLTGLDIYDSLGKRAGAGSIVPISGFANSIVAPAIEYKKEGYVFGVGAKIFNIAGPVIIYGMLASIIVGIGYYFFGQ